jgi:hypothetical protein
MVTIFGATQPARTQAGMAQPVATSTAAQSSDAVDGIGYNLDPHAPTTAMGVRIIMRHLILANSKFAVICVHASKTNCRNPSIF